jgi:hypothetical protein
MTKKELFFKALLEHEDNNPLEFINVAYKEKDWGTDKLVKETCDIAHYINIKYCCFEDGEGGTLEQREEWLLDVFKDEKVCILIYAKFGTIRKFEAAFSREMHWIEQTSTRFDRFQKLYKKLFKIIKSTVENAGGLGTCIEKYYEDLVEMFPVGLRKIELGLMNRSQILTELVQGRIEKDKAEELIRDFEKTERERNSDKLCPFSGRANERPNRICSRTGDPKRLGDCSSCRVAAEWEEAYG